MYMWVSSCVVWTPSANGATDFIWISMAAERWSWCHWDWATSDSEVSWATALQRSQKAHTRFAQTCILAEVWKKGCTHKASDSFLLSFLFEYIIKWSYRLHAGQHIARGTKYAVLKFEERWWSGLAPVSDKLPNDHTHFTQNRNAGRDGKLAMLKLPTDACMMAGSPSRFRTDWWMVK